MLCYSPRLSLQVSDKDIQYCETCKQGFMSEHIKNHRCPSLVYVPCSGCGEPCKRREKIFGEERLKKACCFLCRKKQMAKYQKSYDRTPKMFALVNGKIEKLGETIGQKIKTEEKKKFDWKPVEIKRCPCGQMLSKVIEKWMSKERQRFCSGKCWREFKI